MRPTKLGNKWSAEICAQSLCVLFGFSGASYCSQKVAPSEIEGVIYTHPAVKSVCVVPLEDERAGEVPLACVILKDGHSATEEEIVKLVEGQSKSLQRFRSKIISLSVVMLWP